MGTLRESDSLRGDKFSELDDGWQVEWRAQEFNMILVETQKIYKTTAI